jgi:hypothetical protein
MLRNVQAYLYFPSFFLLNGFKIFVSKILLLFWDENYEFFVSFFFSFCFTPLLEQAHVCT